MSLPLLLEPEQLLPELHDKQLLIIDTSSAQHYRSAHIAGAVHLPAGRMQGGIKPATGKLPNPAALSQLFSEIGLTPEKHVVAVDDEGGGWAGRLLWTLDCIDHQHYSLLNGGMTAWINEGFPVEQSSVEPKPSSYAVTDIQQYPIASLDDILGQLHSAEQAIWDARSPEEYEGSRILAQRGGHIPGAANLEWTELMDPSRNLRLLPLPQLSAILEQHGLTPDKAIITHCQSHHRSGLTYLVAKLLGYPRIKAYDGSWGEWGNRDDTPIAQGPEPLPRTD